MKTFDLETIQNELLTLSDVAVKKALHKGANEAEAIFSFADTISIIVRKRTIDARRGTPSGVGIRVVQGGKVGFAAGTGTSKKLVDSVLEEAISVARIRPRDPIFRQLPDPVQRASNDGIIDPEIQELSEERALTSVDELAKTALDYDKRIRSFYGNLSVNRACLAIVNSRGIEGSTKTAYMKVSARCTAAGKDTQKTGTDMRVSRKLIDLRELGENAAKNSLGMLGAKPLGKTQKSEVLWENTSFGEFLKEMLGYSIDGENVAEERSYYNGKIGEEIATSNITIVDNGQLPEGIVTSKVDGEGVPRQTTKIVDSGVLRSYIYDSYSSLRQNKESSGNAIRDWPEPFLQLPSTSITNLVVKPGTRSIEDLVTEIENGILVSGNVIGVGTSNPRTGDFSIVAPMAYLIRRGEISHPLESVSIAGNFFESLKKVQGIGSDTKLLDEGMLPSLVIEDLTISG